MGTWLEDSIEALAREAGVPAPALTDADAGALLDIARIASHTSGERINAPLLCYLIGRIVEQSSGTSIEALKRVVVAKARDSGPES